MLICRSDDCKAVQDGEGSLTKEARIRSPSARITERIYDYYELSRGRAASLIHANPRRAWVNPRPARSTGALSQGKRTRDPREPLLVKAGQRNLTQRKIYQQHNRHSQKSNWKDIKA